MENIDDLMRQKFDSDDPGERFEFQEEFWEQAQLLLEQEEKRRRGVLWLFFGLAVAVGLLAWFLLSTSGLLSHNPIESKHSENYLESFEKPGNSSQSATNTVPQTTSTTSTTSTTPTDETQKTPETTDKWKNGAVVNDENQSISARKNASSSGDLDAKSGSKSRRNNQGLNAAPNAAKADLKDSAKSGKTEVSNVNPLSTGGNKNAGKTEVSNVNPLSTGGNKNTGNAGVSGQNKPGSSENLGGQNTAETLVNVPNAQDTTRTETKEIPVLTPQILLFNLPNPVEPLLIPARNPKLKTIQTETKQPIVQETKPAKDKRFAFGLSLAGTANQSTDSIGRWAGYALGAYGQYRINPEWSLRLGAQWRFVPGFEAFPSPDSSNPAFVGQIRYSFGYTTETWKLETAGLHSIEIPISTQWNRGRFGAEAGLTLGANFMVQTSTTKTVSSSLNPTPVTTVSRFERGSLSPYKQIYGAALLGAEYRLNARIAVMARGHYRFTQTLKNATTNPGLGSLDLGLRWRLY